LAIDLISFEELLVPTVLPLSVMVASHGFKGKLQIEYRTTDRKATVLYSIFAYTVHRTALSLQLVLVALGALL